MNVSYAAFIHGRWAFSDAPFAGYENTVYQIEDGQLYILKPASVERVEFEEAR